MFRHILFPTDGSGLSRRAAKVAVALAKKHGARLTAFHATPPYMPAVFPDATMYVPLDLISPETYEAATAREAAKILEAVAALARGAGVKVRTSTVASPHPWEAIVKAAKKEKCDLVVMASHGRKGVEGIILGSETTKVLTRSKIPVLVCR